MSSQDLDPGMHRFRKTNLFYTTDPYMLYQDPTILGFKLLFDTHSDGLLCLDPSNKNSALNYLIRIGQTDRAKILYKFINHLKQLNNTTPWFFQGIKGLDEAWKRGFNAGKDFTALLPDDRKIEIECLESIDLRVTALMDMYRKACFDWNYRREIVPWNLRLFSVKIYVYELRTINRLGTPTQGQYININANKKQQNENNTLLGSDPIHNKSAIHDNDVIMNNQGTDIGAKANFITGIKNLLSGNTDNIGLESSNTINPNMSGFMFDMEMCEFSPDDSSTALATIDNKGGEEAKQSIVFTYRNIQEENTNTIYGNDIELKDFLINTLNAASFDITKEVKTNPASSFGVNSPFNPTFGIIAPLADLGVGLLSKAVDNAVGRLVLGNVYGLEPGNLLNSAGNVLNGNPADVLTGISDIANQVGHVTGNSKPNNPNLGNIFE